MTAVTNLRRLCTWFTDCEGYTLSGNRDKNTPNLINPIKITIFLSKLLS